MTGRSNGQENGRELNAKLTEMGRERGIRATVRLWEIFLRVLYVCALQASGLIRAMPTITSNRQELQICKQQQIPSRSASLSSKKLLHWYIGLVLSVGIVNFLLSLTS